MKIKRFLSRNWNKKSIKNSTTPLSGQTIEVNEDNYSFRVEVITGCHICYTIAELVLSRDGQFISLKGIGKQNAKQLSDAELKLIFNVQ